MLSHCQLGVCYSQKCKSQPNSFQIIKPFSHKQLIDENLLTAMQLIGKRLSLLDGTEYINESILHVSFLFKIVIQVFS